MYRAVASIRSTWNVQHNKITTSPTRALSIMELEETCLGCVGVPLSTFFLHAKIWIVPTVQWSFEFCCVHNIYITKGNWTKGRTLQNTEKLFDGHLLQTCAISSVSWGSGFSPHLIFVDKKTRHQSWYFVNNPPGNEKTYPTKRRELKSAKRIVTDSLLPLEGKLIYWDVLAVLSKWVISPLYKVGYFRPLSRL